MARTPSYTQLYNSLKDSIQKKVYSVGSLIPTENELCKIFGVSKTTVRKAVGLLISEGYLQATQGRGTMVLDISASQNLNKITSITETLKAKGFTVTTPMMNIQKLLAPPEIASKMEILANTPVYLVERVLYANDKPVALMQNYLKETSVPDLDKYNGTFIGLYQFIEKKYNIIMRSAKETLSAVAANFTQAQILHVKIGDPLLCSHRLTRTDKGIFEYSITCLCADKYEYVVHLFNRP